MRESIKNLLLISIVSFAIIFTILTIIFFLNGEEFNICYLIDSSKFGDFGSFYGGFLGTVIAIVGFYVLYKTYTYQKTQTELLIVNKLYDDIVKDINDIEYDTHKGIQALYKFDEKHREPGKANSVMNHLSLILTNFINLIDRLDKSKFIPKKVKEINLDRIYLMYNLKITWPVYENIYDKLFSMKDKDGNEIGLIIHTDASVIFERYFELIRKSYNYLEPRNHIKLPLDKPKMMDIINNTMPNSQYTA